MCMKMIVSNIFSSSLASFRFPNLSSAACMLNGACSLVILPASGGAEKARMAGDTYTTRPPRLTGFVSKAEEVPERIAAEMSATNLSRSIVCMWRSQQLRKTDVYNLIFPGGLLILYYCIPLYILFESFKLYVFLVSFFFLSLSLFFSVSFSRKG